MPTKEIMQEAARAAKAKLPEGIGFALFVWNPGTPGVANYVGNCDRRDVVTVVSTFVKRNQEGRIVDTPSGN